MSRYSIFLLTAVAPIIWGSTYYVTTEFLPTGYPLTISMLRALPVGLLFLLVVRQLPSGIWWFRVLLLGGLNFSLFWWMLFESAYRLPGGVAATVISIQPLIVVFLARFLLGSPIRMLAIAAAILGLVGVAVLVITPQASLDKLGIAAGITGAMSMALGMVLTRKWQPPVSQLTFTSWQLIAGGLILLPAAIWFEPPLPVLTTSNLMGLVYLGAIGAGLTYVLWFKGLARIEPSAISTLGFLSPLSAVIIGWLLLDQTLNAMQIGAVFVVFISVWLSQRANRTPGNVENSQLVRKLKPAAESCN